MLPHHSKYYVHSLKKNAKKKQNATKLTINLEN